ncbi:MAG: response regulator transcription factor [Actinomycetia bacterium]|nr:response regulator transcription factor [Actinomycetes bacterium]
MRIDKDAVERHADVHEVVDEHTGIVPTRPVTQQGRKSLDGWLSLLTTTTVPPVSPNTETVAVILVDDHEVVRRGVAGLIDAESDLDVVGHAATVAETHELVDQILTEIDPTSRPVVAVLDVRLPDGNGIAACRELKGHHPDLHCLIFTSYADDQAIVDAAEAGAAAYVIKEVRSNELVSTIRSVAEGRVLLDHAEVRLANSRLRESGEGRLLDLTDRERSIFDLIGEGLSNRQIADRLFLSEKTIKNNVSNLLAKLSMRRRTEAAALSARLSERRHEMGTDF